MIVGVEPSSQILHLSYILVFLRPVCLKASLFRPLRVQYSGVILIIGGVLLQILPGVSSPQGADSRSSFIWQLVFVVALTAIILIYQEPVYHDSLYTHVSDMIISCEVV